MNLRFAPTLNNKLHLGNIRVLLFNKIISEITNFDLILRIDFKDGISEDIHLQNELYIRNICEEYLNIKFKKVIYQKNRKYIYHKYLNSIPDIYKIKLNEIIYLNFQHIQSNYKYIKYNDFVFGNMKKLSYLINSIPIYNISSDVFFYNFTSVVDDIEQDIKIIVRGSDHLDNTFLQIMIFMCLNAENKIPKFCHIPLCLTDVGNKISKSNQSTNIYLDELLNKEFILPETLFKYLTGYTTEEKIISLENLNISNKNKLINLSNLIKTNIQIIKNIDIYKLQFYLKKIKLIDIDLQTLKSIQPFIICINKFLNAINTIIYIRKNSLNLEKLILDKRNLLKKQFLDYKNFNLIFDTNLGNEIIKNIDSDTYNKIKIYINQYC